MVKSFALLWMVGTSSLYGVVGELEPDITVRYGLSIKTDNFETEREFRKTYQSDGWTILVVFVDGRSEFENYRRADGRPLARAEIEALLNANKSGAEWKKDPSATAGQERWLRFDAGGKEEAKAVYHQYPQGCSFVISTKTFEDYRAQERKFR